MTDQQRAELKFVANNLARFAANCNGGKVVVEFDSLKRLIELLDAACVDTKCRNCRNLQKAVGRKGSEIEELQEKLAEYNELPIISLF